MRVSLLVCALLLATACAVSIGPEGKDAPSTPVEEPVMVMDATPESEVASGESARFKRAAPHHPVRRPLPCRIRNFKSAESQKIALLVVHGIGATKKDFATNWSQLMMQRFEEVLSYCEVKDLRDQVVVEPVFWADIVQDQKNSLMDAYQQNAALNNMPLRNFVLSLVGSGMSYEPEHQKKENFFEVQRRMAQALSRLGKRAGPNAPLVVVAHSFGSVVVRDFFVNIQNGLTPAAISNDLGTTPVSVGDTLTQLYTMGSPLPMFSIQEPDFGKAPTVPSPQLSYFWPIRLQREAKWSNYYDANDIIGYPLKPLNKEYSEKVTHDVLTNLAVPDENKFPAAHSYYWAAPEVVEDVAYGLARSWLAVNHHFATFSDRVDEDAPPYSSYHDHTA